MKKVIIEPITILRDTNKISELCNYYKEPIYITKNGTNDLVIMSDEVFQTKYAVSYDNELQTVDSSFINYTNTFNFVRVGCHTIETSVLNVKDNLDKIKKEIEIGKKNKEKIMVFSELTLTGYSCSDMFFQSSLINNSLNALIDLKKFTKGLKALVIIGLPISIYGRLYNAAAAINNGHILGIVLKSQLPNYKEFYEGRHFSSGAGVNGEIDIDGERVSYGTRIIFVAKDNPNIRVGIEICEDLWTYDSPSIDLAKSNATIICNLSASNELAGKNRFRKDLISVTSSKLNVAYIYCSAGQNESTTDVLYGGASYIYNGGYLIKENKLYDTESIFADIDIEPLLRDRQMKFSKILKNTCKNILCDIECEDMFEEKINAYPFLGSDEKYQEILDIQAHALAQRLKHINARPVLGLSGGLDSTLALIVCIEAMKVLGKINSDVIAISMPCFGTSKTTADNASKLAEVLNVDFSVIDIKESVNLHLNSIGHNDEEKDIAYENAQARERTQILMDVANMKNGLVIGTGDLSEACLGWSTYNGDHMSNYAVNISIPKTLVKELVRYYAKCNKNLSSILLDIINTPISPELIADSEKEITQRTEDIIGPYELHDFFIFQILKYGYSPKKVFFLAKKAFKNYDHEIIKKWLIVFYKRFINSQFKRSCLPDGIKATQISISPRGDLRMPSDGDYKMFEKELLDL